VSPTENTILGGRYTLTRRIAVGGMGEVWSATDLVLDRTVAVKLMHPGLSQESNFLERFRAEARHTASLHHPNIATVFDYGEDGGTAYLVMELVLGQTLSEVIAERAPLSAQETTAILIQAANALETAHQGGVVHRDVKPANILITSDGTAKLTDFGISRAVDAVPLTQTGQVLGTAHYLSPEQAMGQSGTASSDIYALAVVGHEMLTGARPFNAGSLVAIALAQVNQAPPPLPETVPIRLRDVLSAALSKDPADRPASAAAMAQALGMPDLPFAPAAPVASVPHVSIAPSASPPTAVMPALLPPDVGDRQQRRPAWLIGAAAGAMLLTVLVASALWGGDPKAPGAPTPAISTSAPGASDPKSGLVSTGSDPAIGVASPEATSATDTPGPTNQNNVRRSRNGKGSGDNRDGDNSNRKGKE
jgi:serine/threonine-protein kinase